MTWTLPRTAAKRHVCSSCSASIEAGARYLEHVAAPNDNDLGNLGWWRLAECADCAARYGRGFLLAA